MRAAVRIPLRASNLDAAATVLKRNYHRHSSPLSTNLQFKPSSWSSSSFRSFSGLSSSLVTTTNTKSTTRSWSCRRCSLSDHSASRTYFTRTPAQYYAARDNGNNNGREKKKDKESDAKSQRRYIKYAVIGGVLGVGAVVFSDQIEHFCRAAERTGRVVAGLAICINE